MIEKIAKLLDWIGKKPKTEFIEFNFPALGNGTAATFAKTETAHGLDVTKIFRLYGEITYPPNFRYPLPAILSGTAVAQNARPYYTDTMVGIEVGANMTNMKGRVVIEYLA